MEITVVGRASRKLEAELGELHVRVQFEEENRAAAVARAQEVAAGIQQFASMRAPQIHDASPSGARPDPRWPRLVVDGLRTHSWNPTSQAGEVMRERWNASVMLHYRAERQLLQVMIDHLGEADGVHIERLTWTLIDETRDTVRAEVLAEAVQDAAARGQVMADAGGGGAVEFVQLADPGLLGNPGQPAAADSPQMVLGRMMASDSAFESSVSLEPDLLEITEQVHARFRA
nr:SIMPL domain-containing protein [Actinomycetales bacterium]